MIFDAIETLKSKVKKEFELIIREKIAMRFSKKYKQILTSFNLFKNVRDVELN